MFAHMSHTMLRIAMAALALGAFSGCCCGTREYVQPVGPFQAMTVHTIDETPAPPTASPRVHVTRHYMGARGRLLPP